MIDKTTALKMVSEHINASNPIPRDQLVVIEEETIEKDYGWVFFYTSRKNAESNYADHLVAGNGPIIVESESGAMTQLGTALPSEEYIKEYEARRHRGKLP